MKEHAWLTQKLTNRHNSPVSETTSQDVEDVEEEGGDIECGCCFSSYSFVGISGRCAFVLLISLAEQDGTMHRHSPLL